VNRVQLTEKIGQTISDRGRRVSRYMFTEVGGPLMSSTKRYSTCFPDVPVPYKKLFRYLPASSSNR
jgi:hypothetical protein